MYRLHQRNGRPRFAVLLPFLACLPAIALASEPSLQVTMTPVPDPSGGEIERVLIHEELGVEPLPEGATLVEIRHQSYNLPTLLNDMEGLSLSDECGELDVEHRDIVRGSVEVRQWYAGRETCGAIDIEYAVPAHAAGAVQGVAPPVELRSEGRAVSGGATTFLLRPADGHYRLGIDWDFSALPFAASGVSSLQSGAGEPLPIDVLDDVFVMGGNLGRYPASSTKDGFYSAWQGEPGFDPLDLMKWAHDLREHFIDFFSADCRAYGVMMRFNPVNAGGGIGMHNSFVVTYGEGTAKKLPELRSTLSHEMFHTFQPRMEAPSGDQKEALALSWFNEGLAVFYQREFPYRAGMMTNREYLDDLNFHAARYYTSAMARVPNSDVPEGFWRDTRIRTLPYDRGFLYFATVDESLRSASGGSRSLDDLVKELRRMMDRGVDLTPDVWAGLLKRELGNAAVKAFHGMLAGEPPVPSARAFGPCFTRGMVPLRRYELGFDPAVLTKAVRRVTGLEEHSAAAKAGLKNGDIILEPVPQDAIQGTQDATLTLKIQRGDAVFDLEYLPRGERVEVWQWREVPGHHQDSCARR